MSSRHYEVRPSLPSSLRRTDEWIQNSVPSTSTSLRLASTCDRRSDT
jgi:hypothetical protein